MAGQTDGHKRYAPTSCSLFRQTDTYIFHSHMQPQMWQCSMVAHSRFVLPDIVVVLTENPLKSLKAKYANKMYIHILKKQQQQQKRQQ